MKLTITEDVLFTDQAATGTSQTKRIRAIKKTFQARGTASTAGAATIVVEATNFDDAANGDWTTLGTITLTLGATSTSDGFTSDAPWKYVRARITAISGATPSVDVVVAG